MNKDIAVYKGNKDIYDSYINKNWDKMNTKNYKNSPFEAM